VPRVQQIILDTLQTAADTGFEAERVEAIIHQIELSQKSVKSNFGLGLLLRLFPYWARNADAFSPLHINAYIATIRQRLSEGPYFQELLRQYILFNPHRVTLVMRPDEDYAKKEQAVEEARLKALQSTLTQQDRDRITAQAAELARMQQSKPDATCLPTLRLSDIAKTSEQLVFEPSTHVYRPGAHAPSSKVKFSHSIPPTRVYPESDRCEVMWLPQPTNGIVYISLLSSLHRLPAELRPVYPLFRSVFTEMGTRSMDYRELSHRLDLVTGGLSASAMVHSGYNDLSSHHEPVVFSGAALTRNVNALLAVWREVLLESTFSNQTRLLMLLRQYAAGIANSLQDSGSSYAMSYASSALTPAALVNEQLGGMSYVRSLNALVTRIEEEVAATGSSTADSSVINTPTLGLLCKQLQDIARWLVKEGGIERALVVGDEASLAACRQAVPQFLYDIHSNSAGTV